MSIITTYNLNHYIYYTVCNKDLDFYNKIIDDFKNEYNVCIKKLCNSKNIPDIRFNAHKMISVISWLDILEEILYYCKMILAIDKKDNDINYYNTYIDIIKNIQNYNIFPLEKIIF